MYRNKDGLFRVTTFIYSWITPTASTGLIRYLNRGTITRANVLILQNVSFAQPSISEAIF